MVSRIKKTFSGLSWKVSRPSASVFLTHLNSTADPGLNQAEFIIPRHVSFQSPDGYIRPSYAVHQLKGWRERDISNTKGLEKCPWQAHMWLMLITPGLGGYGQVDPVFRTRVRGLAAPAWRPEFDPQYPCTNPDLALTLVCWADRRIAHTC